MPARDGLMPLHPTFIHFQMSSIFKNISGSWGYAIGSSDVFLVFQLDFSLCIVPNESQVTNDQPLTVALCTLSLKCY